MLYSFTTLFVLLSTILLPNGIASDDSGAEILYSMYQAETAHLPNNPIVKSSVVTHISVESEMSEEYSESFEDNQNEESREEPSRESNVTSSDDGVTTESPMGRRLPPVRAHSSDPEERSSVVDHSISSDEMDVMVGEQSLEEATGASNFEYATEPERNITVWSSVQTSKSMEEGEISYEEYTSEESREENGATENAETTTEMPEKSRIIELVVTSTSVIREEFVDNGMELMVNTTWTDTTTSSPVTLTVPIEITNDSSTIIYFDGNSVTTDNVTMPNFDTSPNTINTWTKMVENVSTTTVTPQQSTVTPQQSTITPQQSTVTPQQSTVTFQQSTKRANGKSIKTLFNFDNAMTEDPSVLAKLLPPTTTQSDKAVKFKTFTDKQGKTYTLKLLTEDPSVLAAMTPPPIKNQTESKIVKSFIDKTSGKNVTFEIPTEDPNVLAAMTPPPKVNITNETSPPPKLVHYPGVPQQFGKLPIITRHNVTRKPFLRSKPPNRNARPPPTFKKLSEIFNRSRAINTKRPLYVKQAHEGDYQSDPDKRSSQGIVTVTTVRTTTTLSPIFRWGKYVAVGGNLKIVSGTHWDEDLRNFNSVKFKRLANEIEENLDKIFRYSPLLAGQYKGIEVDSFSKGSVLVDYTLYLKEDVRGSIEEMSKSTYRDGLENGTFLGTFKVDPVYANFRVITPENIELPPSTEEALVFPHWAISIVGSGIAAIVFLVILCVIRRCSARSARRKYGAPLTNDAAQDNKKSVKTGYDNPVLEGVYDLDNVYNEKSQRQRQNSSTSIYSNASRSGRDSKPNGKIQSSKRNDNYNDNLDIYGRDPFGKEPVKRQDKMNYDEWDEWDDFYDTRQSDKYYKRDYDTTF